MKHAGDSALDALEPLLVRIRAAAPELTERKRGIFYRGGAAALHFHDDPDGLFVDWRVAKGDKDFTRLRVSTKTEQAVFLKALKR